MTRSLLLILLIILIEILLAFLFSITSQLLYKKLGFDFKSIIKGLIERLFLMVAFLNDYTSALTFFSALKLGTRLKHDETGENKNRYNDYYLIGNLVSVGIAFLYVYLYKNIEHISILHKLIE